MKISKYFKTPFLKYFMKLLIFNIKWLNTFKNMIKVFKVSTHAIHAQQQILTCNWFTYFVAVDYT